MKKRQSHLSALVITAVIVLLALFGLIANLIGYSQFTKTLTAQYQDNAISIADEAADMVNVDELMEFLPTNGGTEGFARLHGEMQHLCDNMKAEFIYIIDVDRPNYDKITYLFEVVNENSKFDEYPIGLVKDTTNEDYRLKYKGLWEGTMDNAIVVRDKGFIESGSHITALVPIKDASGNTVALLSLQRQMEYLDSARLNYLESIVAASIMLIMAASAGMFMILNRRMLQPISSISKEAERFASENTLPEKALSGEVTHNDELGSLARTIDEMEHQTLDYFTTLNQVTAEKERVDAELNLATQIQANMLPSIFPPFPEHTEFDLFATMDPAKEVGGDFYDMFLVDKTHLGVVIADVSGKGVPAALFMVIAKTLIKTHAQMGLTPSETFTKVNNILCESNKSGLFVTAWMAIYDTETGKLTYVNAGHNPPLIKLGDKGYEYLKARPGFVLSGMEDVRYRQAELTMQKGDRLFLYTDGITEATSAAKELYGEDRLITYMNAHQEDALTELLPGLRANIDEFVGDAPQFDDMTMLCLQIK